MIQIGKWIFNNLDTEEEVINFLNDTIKMLKERGWGRCTLCNRSYDLGNEFGLEFANNDTRGWQYDMYGELLSSQCCYNCKLPIRSKFFGAMALANKNGERDNRVHYKHIVQDKYLDTRCKSMCMKYLGITYNENGELAKVNSDVVFESQEQMVTMLTRTSIRLLEAMVTYIENRNNRVYKYFDVRVNGATDFDWGAEYQNALKKMAVYYENRLTMPYCRLCCLEESLEESCTNCPWVIAEGVGCCGPIGDEIQYHPLANYLGWNDIGSLRRYVYAVMNDTPENRRMIDEIIEERLDILYYWIDGWERQAKSVLTNNGGE